MTATDELRRMLNERGVEWRDGDAAATTEWKMPDGRLCSAMYWKPKLTVCIGSCTPEQAIAATLGNRGYYTDRDDEGTHITCSQCGEYMGTSEEIAATLGGGECELVYGENDHGDDGWWCQSCGGWFAASFRHTGRNNIIEPSYCQFCGRKAVDA